MNDYQERMLEEKIELQYKVGKLRHFIFDENPIYKELGSIDKDLLNDQLNAMEHYLNILRERINRL